MKYELIKLGLENELVERDFDRAHRVGSTTDREGNQIKERQMIVKFTSFQARTNVYSNRPKFNNREEGEIRIYVDQTKRRFNLRKMAIDYVKNKPKVDFVFVDINCSLCIRFKSGQYKFFNSEEELLNLVG